MKGSYIWAVLVVAVCAIISLDLLSLWNDGVKSDEIKAVKDQVAYSIYIDSLRTAKLLDSLARISKALADQHYRIEAYNRAVRVQNNQIRKQNENMVTEIDSLRYLIDVRPDY